MYLFKAKSKWSDTGQWWENWDKGKSR